MARLSLLVWRRRWLQEERPKASNWFRLDYSSHYTHCTGQVGERYFSKYCRTSWLLKDLPKSSSVGLNCQTRWTRERWLRHARVSTRMQTTFKKTTASSKRSNSQVSNERKSNWYSYLIVDDFFSEVRPALWNSPFLWLLLDLRTSPLLQLISSRQTVKYRESFFLFCFACRSKIGQNSLLTKQSTWVQRSK